MVRESRHQLVERERASTSSWTIFLICAVLQVN